MKRVQSIYQHHRRRARQAGLLMLYTGAELLTLVRESLHTGCPYCGRMLMETTFTIDHRIPTSRNGPHALDNLLVCCKPCNEQKGLMTETEFRQLLDLLSGWPIPVRLNTLARLRSGGKHLHRGTP